MCKLFARVEGGGGRGGKEGTTEECRMILGYTRLERLILYEKAAAKKV